MNRLLMISFIALLTGCASQIYHPQTYPAYESSAPTVSSFKKCTPLEITKHESAVTKSEFLKDINNYAMFIEVQNFISKDEEESLRKFGWNADASSAIADCSSNQMMAALNAMKSPFNELKSKTKNKEEKKALISAYSAWEIYIKNPSPQTKQKFEEYTSYYSNL
ncbi:hypothetical protein ACT497_002326 [Salmonella enterica subsp. enterica serovar Glostrup]|nr:hypothetical protein [Salmonella enterica]EBS0890099.1 hypothetical protein [Salmonella enterica subsp. enterica serovar Abaetetuba]EKR1732400.1 hypothetical protein [Salmonella enterica subsp. enterica serovar Madelia]ECD1969916.1 hypothetical protein [Salmonella enterica subsp. enterica serovar Abaetetuba]EGK5854869.1 hypothetical protein [Salmonella enterica]